MRRIKITLWGIAAALASLTSRAYGASENNYAAIGLAFPQVNLDMTSKATATNTATSTTDYSAETSGLFTTEASYDGITLGYGFVMGGVPKGSSVVKYTNFDLSYFSSFWGVSAAYVNLTGMNATSGTGQTSASITANPESARSDIRLTTADANFWIAPYRHNLDLNDFFSPARKPHGCGFAVVMIGAYDSFGVAAQRPLYLSPSAAPYGSDRAFVGGQFYSGSISLGPAMMLEKYEFYLAAFLAFGGGEETGRYSDGNTNLTTHDRPMKTLLYAALGYRGPTYFTAFTYQLEQPQYTLATVELQATRGNLAWMFGRRF